MKFVYSICVRFSLLTSILHLDARESGSYNSSELLLILIPCTSAHDLLQQMASISVRFHRTLEVLRIVEQHGRIGLLQRP